MIEKFIIMFLLVLIIQNIRLSIRVGMLEKLLIGFVQNPKNLPNRNPSVRPEGGVQEIANPEKHSPENCVPKSPPSTPKTLIEMLKEDNPKTIIQILKEENDEQK